MRNLAFRASCNAYLNARRGTYDFRKIRYRSVADKLIELGLKQDDLVVDLGAGRCEFNHYLHEIGQRVCYCPVDGSIDGTNLEHWDPGALRPAFFVAIELLEHLHCPMRLLSSLLKKATKGVVITTPNPLTTDVLGMDPTHLTPLHPIVFDAAGGRVEIRSHFGKPDDSILAWWKTSQIEGSSVA